MSTLQTPPVFACIVAVSLLFAGPACGDSPPSDNVERLGQILDLQPNDLSALDPAAVRRVVESKDQAKVFAQERLRLLKERADSLESLGQLKRALLLYGWGYQATPLESKDVESIYQDLLHRFTQKFQAVLTEKAGPRRLGALVLISDWGRQLRTSIAPKGIGRLFTKDLGQFLRRDPTSLEKALVARALGESFPDPALAIPILEMLMQSKEAEDRRAASEALMTMSKTAQNLHLVVGIAEMAETGRAVLPLAGNGLADSDALVRLHCVRAIHAAAKALPSDAKLAGSSQNQQEEAEVTEAKAAYGSFLLLAKELGGKAGLLTPLLNDTDIDVVLAADEALEVIAEARKFWPRVASILSSRVDQSDPLAAGLQTALPGLEKQLGHADVRVRLGALYVLESMGKDGSTIAQAIAKCIKDKDVFVRWAVARVFGAMAPLAPEHAVPALSKVIDDKNGDVVMSTLDALRHYGPAAGNAAPALGTAVNRGSAEMRVLAIQALGAIGPNGKEAAPALVQALKSPDVSVRAAAARALGSLAPTDPMVIDSLVTALEDSNADVRSVASESLLNSR